MTDQKHLLHHSQRRPTQGRHHWCRRGEAHQRQLEECVVLANRRRMYLRRRQRKVPVPHEGLWRRQGDPPVVDGRDT